MRKDGQATPTASVTGKPNPKVTTPRNGRNDKLFL